jgi:hypothetical protein
MEEKQKNILKSFFEMYTKLVLSKKNAITLNLKSVYTDRIKIKNEDGTEEEIDDETWKLFNGICPSDKFLKAKLNFDTITDTKFEKSFNKEDITPEFLNKFKEMYENLIEFYNEKYIDPMLLPLMYIIQLGTARIISQNTESMSNFEDIDAKYNAELSKFVNEQTKKGLNDIKISPNFSMNSVSSNYIYGFSSNNYGFYR